MAVKRVTPSKTTLRNYDDLTAEEKAIMDRAVKAARTAYWCGVFDRTASEIFQVPETNVVDLEGYDCHGYTREGFDKDGFNRDGLDAEGYNKDGLNAKGFDRDGFDRYGFNKAGLDKDGHDKYKFDDRGFDREGFDYYGQTARQSRAWYAKQAARPDTDFVYDQNGRQRPEKTPVKRAPRKAASTTEILSPAKRLAPAKAARAAVVPAQKRQNRSRITFGDI